MAKAAGEKTYWTGRPCAYGHTAMRYTSTGQCSACHHIVHPNKRADVRNSYAQRSCPQCGKDMPWSQRKSECCSRKCSNTKAYHSRAGLAGHKDCRWCGASFHAKPAEFYCSSRCRGMGRLDKSSVPARLFARLLRLKWRHTQLKVVDLMTLLAKQDGKCALTGRPMTFWAGKGNVWSNASIDRIDSRLGYVLDNIQLTCVAINKMKRDYAQSDFVQWCRDVVSEADRGVAHAV